MRFPCCLRHHRSVFSALFLFILLGVLAALAVLVFGWVSFRTKWLALVPGVVAVNVQHAMQSTAHVSSCGKPSRLAGRLEGKRSKP